MSDLTKMPTSATGLTLADISKAVAVIYAGTHAYGRPLDGSMAQAWWMVAQTDAWTSEDLRAIVQHFVMAGGALPVAGEAREWLASYREALASAERTARATEEARAERIRQDKEIEERWSARSADEARTLAKERLGL